MSSPLIVPKFVFPGGVYGVAGSALSGFKVNTYAAGTATPQATYTDSTLAVANANPVVMDANGQANIWLGNLAYKFVGTDVAGTVLWTVDNVTQASLGSLQNEWVSFNAVPVFISATSFSLTGIVDLTLSPYFIAVGTRIRTTNTGGTAYGTVITVSGNTIVVRSDGASIDAGISAAYYGIIAGANSSTARRTLVTVQNGGNVNMVNGVATQLTFNTIPVDYLSENSGSNSVTVKVAGSYRVRGIVNFNEGAATTGIANVAQTVSVRKNGGAVSNSTINWPVAASIVSTQQIAFETVVACVTNDQLDVSCTAGFTGTAPTAALFALTVERLL